MLWHKHLHQLNIISCSERFILQQPVHLCLGAHLISLGLLWVGIENIEEHGILPPVDVVVFGLGTVNLAFDSVAVIIKYESVASVSMVNRSNMGKCT